MHQNWKFHHVAVVVRDMNRAIKHYQTLDIGPFPPRIGPPTGKAAQGNSPAPQMDLRHAQGGVGGLTFELIQPLGGESPTKEFLEKKGEGIHHIGFTVDDLDKEAAELAQRGFKVIQHGETPTVKYSYFGTDAVGGVVIELIQMIPAPKA